MRVYKGFLSSAVQEALAKLKTGEARIEMPGTAIQNGMDPAAYQAAVESALAANAVNNADAIQVLLDGYPTTLGEMLESLAQSYDVWLKWGGRATQEEVLTSRVLAVYQHLTYAANNLPNSNISDIKAGKALYTGLVITGSEVLKSKGSQKFAVVSEARKVFGKSVTIKNDSITKIGNKYKGASEAERWPAYAGGSLKNADWLGDSIREDWISKVEELLAEGWREKLRANAVNGFAIIVDSTQYDQDARFPAMLHEVGYDWLQFDEITGPESELFAQLDELKRTGPSSCEVVEVGDGVQLAPMSPLGRILATSRSYMTDHAVYEVGLNMLYKQAQVQQALDERDSSANGGTKFSFSWWWLLLLLLFLIIIIAVVIFATRSKGEKTTTVNIQSSAQPDVEVKETTKDPRIQRIQF